LFRHNIRTQTTMAAPSEERRKKLTLDESLDFAEALSVSLGYLCWINADVVVVDSFLRRFPEALLFDGTPSNKRNARHILEVGMSKCRCHHERECNNNRRKLLEMLERGFPLYQDIHIKDILKGRAAISDQKNVGLNSTKFFPQLMATSRELRRLNADECRVRGRMTEVHVRTRALQRELEIARMSFIKRLQQSVLSVFACGNKNHSTHLGRLQREVETMESRYKFAQNEHNLLSKLSASVNKTKSTSSKDLSVIVLELLALAMATPIKCVVYNAPGESQG